MYLAGVAAPSTHRLHPPVFLALAGHPVRWRLLQALAASDLRVGELCAELSLAQNLVSYHLARLRSAGVVRRRRSAADGRDSYYTLDLNRCRDLIADSGAALHPALRPQPSAGPSVHLGSRAACRVLFACTGNSARSRIAEALISELSEGQVIARSAGSHPKPLHPNAVRVLRERGITLRRAESTHLDTLRSEHFDSVITLCDRVREVCPEFPAHPAAIHWSMGDPARTGTTDGETYPAFRATLTELEERIGFLLARIAAEREGTGL
jgi:protein-tyrosine-phosphatase/DNA-binding transcriptional ArsR family regulator